MQFTFGRYHVDVDVERTRAFYESNRAIPTSQQCICPGCQNYDKAILTAPPAVTDFLRSLGIDPQKPGEVFGVEGVCREDRRYWYNGWYHVVGTLEEGAVTEIHYDDSNRYQPAPDFDFSVWFDADRSHMGPIEDGFPDPILELSIDTTLPWLVESEP